MPKAYPYSDSDLQALGLARPTLPRHVAVIMDGNGRWAARHGLARVEGHRCGARAVRAIVEECCRLGLDQLTLYCLSVENWKRPPEELAFLMALLEQYLIEERSEILEQNIRFACIGRREGLPPEVLRELDETLRLSATNTGTRLCLAINYGGRTELVDAVRKLAGEVAQGVLQPSDIGEEDIGRALYTSGMPDPDLLLRTSGEMRISNYLLWQISYAEIWVTDKCWPDFEPGDLHAALRDYAARERRFGGIGAIEFE